MGDTEGSDSAGEIRLRLFGLTDVGQVREHNEDNFLIADLGRKQRGLREGEHELVLAGGAVFGVCDGMGGAAAGEVASQLAVDIIFEKLSEAGTTSDRDDLARSLLEAVEEAGARIFHNARTDRTHRGMGTTSTIGALIDERLFLAQVGDSRAYILRGAELVQVTRDQSLVNQLIEAGQLTEEEAETFEHNNIILQALGTSETVQVDLTCVDLEQDDTLLICSDGLSGMVKTEELREVLLTESDPVSACHVLTQKANLAGGHDNITVIVVKFNGERLVRKSNEPLAYRKYSLPDRPAPIIGTADDAPALGSIPAPPGDAPGMSVGYTVVGTKSDPVSSAPPALGRTVIAESSAAEEPIVLPTSHFAPKLVGVIVVSALLLIATLGLVLLR